MLGGGGSWFDKLPPEADVSHHERAIETRQKAVAIKSFWIPAQGRDDGYWLCRPCEFWRLRVGRRFDRAGGAMLES